MSNDLTMRRPVSNSTERFAYLDVFRAVACLSVFFFHQGINLTFVDLPYPGYLGVHFFFVLSGYLLGGRYVDAYAGGKLLPKPLPYILKRFLRIYPPYAVCLTIFIALRIASGVQPPDGLNCLLRYLLIFNYWDRYDFFSINATFWSLAIEMQFYLLLPLAAAAVTRLPIDGNAKSWVFPAFMLLIGIASRTGECLFINHVDPRAVALVRFKWVTSYLDLFAVGILARSVEIHWLKPALLRSHAMPRWILLASSISLLTVGAVWTQVSGHWQNSADFAFLLLGPPLVSGAFAMLILCVATSQWRHHRLFQWKPLVWVGLISYSMYLYHLGVLFAINRILRPTEWGVSWSLMCWGVALIALPLALFVSWLAYILVECPSTKWASAIQLHRKPASSVANATVSAID